MPRALTSSDQYSSPERLLTTEEVAELIGVSPRMVLALPIPQIRLGTRTIRYRLRDVYEFLGIDEPECRTEPT
jgi:hypothetical protein